MNNQPFSNTDVLIFHSGERSRFAFEQLADGPRSHRGGRGRVRRAPGAQPAQACPPWRDVGDVAERP